MDVREQVLALKERIMDMVTKATVENRDLTEAEHSEVLAITEQARALKAHADKADKAAALLAGLAEPVGTGGDEPPDARRAWSGSPKAYVGPGGSAWAKAVSARLETTASRLGVKALLSGEIDVPPAVEIVELPAVPTTLLDLVARVPVQVDLTRPGATGNTFSYLRQTVRDNQAAVVADGEVKPTSVFTFAEITDQCYVVAHLSEPFPQRYLGDHESLATILDGQMVAGVRQEVERLLVEGSDLSGEPNGIMSVTGVTDVPFLGDVLTTIRHARTVLEGKGERVTAWALNPVDVEGLDLTRADDGAGEFLMTAPLADLIFGPGVRRVSSLAVPAGTALAADWTTIRLRIREDAQTLAATQAGELWTRNQVQLRSEGRYGWELRRPQALAVVHLSAESSSGS